MNEERGLLRGRKLQTSKSKLLTQNVFHWRDWARLTMTAGSQIQTGDGSHQGNEGNEAMSFILRSLGCLLWVIRRRPGAGADGLGLIQLNLARSGTIRLCSELRRDKLGWIWGRT